MVAVAGGECAKFVKGLGLSRRIGQVQRGALSRAGEDRLGNGGGHEFRGGVVADGLEHLLGLGRSGSDVTVGEFPGGCPGSAIRLIRHGDLLVTGPNGPTVFLTVSPSVAGHERA